MELLKQRWFWAVLVALASLATVAAFVLTSKISGQEGLSFVATGVLGAMLAALGLKGPGAKALLVFLLPALASCSGWQDRTRTALQTIHASSQATEALALPFYDGKCGAVAKRCKTLGDATCNELTECHGELQTVRKMLDGLDRAVAACYSALAVGDESNAKSRLLLALKALEQVDAALRAAGLYKGVP